MIVFESFYYESHALPWTPLHKLHVDTAKVRYGVLPPSSRLLSGLFRRFILQSSKLAVLIISPDAAAATCSSLAPCAVHEDSDPLLKEETYISCTRLSQSQCRSLPPRSLTSLFVLVLDTCSKELSLRHPQ